MEEYRRIDRALYLASLPAPVRYADRPARLTVGPHWSVEQDARHNRGEYDAFPVLERFAELRKIVARYEIFAAIWPHKLAPNGFGLLFIKGEELAEISGEQARDLAIGFFKADDAPHAQGLKAALDIKRFVEVSPQLPK